MSIYKSISRNRIKFGYYGCVGVLAAALAVGFGLNRLWIGLVGTGLVAAAWIIAIRYSLKWLAHISMIASTGLACTGVLTDVPVWLMVMAGGFVLAAWDLLNLIMAVSCDPDNPPNRRFIDTHLRSLAAVVGLSIPGAIIGRLIQWDLPFVALFLITGLFLVVFDRVWRILAKG